MNPQEQTVELRLSIFQLSAAILIPHKWIKSCTQHPTLQTQWGVGLLFVLGSNLPHPWGGVGAVSHWGLFWALKVPAGLVMGAISFYILGTLNGWLIRLLGGEIRTSQARWLFVWTSIPFLLSSWGESVYLQFCFPAPGAAWLELTQLDSPVLFYTTLMTALFSCWGTVLNFLAVCCCYRVSRLWGVLCFLGLPLLLNFAGLALVCWGRFQVGG